MKLGIYLNPQHRERDDPARRLAETLEQVRLVRSLGFDSIWAGAAKRRASKDMARVRPSRLAVCDGARLRLTKARKP